MIQQIIGHIVVGPGGPMKLVVCNSAPRGGVLLYGGSSPATVFPERQRAQRAIDRTRRWANRWGYKEHHVLAKPLNIVIVPLAILPRAKRRITPSAPSASSAAKP